MLTQKNRRIAAAVAAASSLAASFEGLRQYAYYDPPGILTVCYGSTTNVEKGRKYSLEECEDRLNDDMTFAVATVEGCQPGLPEPVLIAFADAVFNMGPTIACDRGRSTAARLLATKQYDAACNQLPRWNKARVAGQMVELPGLTKRRLKEQALCLNGS